MMKSLLFFASVTLVTGVTVLVAQKNSVAVQPRPDQLPAPGSASPKPSRPVGRAEGLLPSVPAGFTVTSYAEIQAPRLMVYAPNGDLFVSSPGTSSITVLRDANNDGVFEARSVFAKGDPPAPVPAAAGREGARGSAPPGGRVAPSILGANAPPCAPPPSFAERGPGALEAPF